MTFDRYRKCRLTNKSMNGHTRTPSIEGVCDHPPEPGYRFSVWNDQPLDVSAGATSRMVTTSTIVSASLDGKNIDFLTETGTNYFWEDLS